MIIKDADIVGWRPWLKFVWKGHITNWLWKDRLERRLTRQKFYGEMKDGYFRKYLSFVRNLRAMDKIAEEWDPKYDKMFSLWLQGRDKAPDIVKRCLETLQKNFGDKFILLTEETLEDYIQLPDFIIDKWKAGKIIPANFSDIVRIELLSRHGGYWFDATDYVMAPVPEIIRNADFFMYRTSPTVYTHMFVQTCFMRAKKGDPLIRMWRDLVFEYWKNENRSADYFLVHMLLKFLVSNNEEAKRLFEKMPLIYQDDIHLLWYDFGNLPFQEEYINTMRSKVFFQKCSYRPLKNGVNKIIPGTTAEYLLTGDLKT